MSTTRALLIPLALIAAVLVIAPTATAAPKFKLNPTSPIVDDDVTVSWRADRNLKEGYVYRALLIAAPGSGCSGFVVKRSQRRPKKGKPMSFRFTPSEDPVEQAYEWCQGKASIMVSIVKESAPEEAVGNLLDTVAFRFRAKP